jgi:hypothetical protein
MPSLGVQVHLYGDPNVLQRNVVSQRIVYIVHVVILRLKQKRGGRPAGDMEIWVQRKTFIGNRKMIPMRNP